MFNENRARRDTPVASETLIHHLETLSHALFFVDAAATILYANSRAQTMIGATAEEVCGKSLWHCAPQLVNRALYYAMRRAQRVQTLTEVQYRSSLTQTWLQVQLSPASGGLLLQFQEGKTPVQRLQQATSSHHPSASSSWMGCKGGSAF